MEHRHRAASTDNTAEKIGKTFAYCVLIVVSVFENTFIGIIVYKTKTMRKTINFLIVNMAMSDLLFPLILFPRIVITLYLDSWMIDGPLGQALLFTRCLHNCVYSEPGSDSSGSIWSCGISPPFPTHQFKVDTACPFLLLGSSRWLPTAPIFRL